MPVLASFDFCERVRNFAETSLWIQCIKISLVDTRSSLAPALSREARTDRSASQTLIFQRGNPRLAADLPTNYAGNCL